MGRRPGGGPGVCQARASIFGVPGEEGAARRSRSVLQGRESLGAYCKIAGVTRAMEAGHIAERAGESEACLSAQRRRTQTVTERRGRAAIQPFQERKPASAGRLGTWRGPLCEAMGRIRVSKKTIWEMISSFIECGYRRRYRALPLAQGFGGGHPRSISTCQARAGANAWTSSGRSGQIASEKAWMCFVARRERHRPNATASAAGELGACGVRAGVERWRQHSRSWTHC